jgi:hypothetical protein
MKSNLSNLFVLAILFVALTCSACGASIQTAAPSAVELVRDFPEPQAEIVTETATERDAPETLFVVDGYEVPATPAPITVYGASSAEEAERWLEEADITEMGCQRAVAGNREAWVCTP